ncbi:MAG: hypothetical protein HY553_17635 [Elusimicrobia bacterium]|nr:hypothetical protein [Elusimicrobiota bacterium]
MKKRFFLSRSSLALVTLLGVTSLLRSQENADPAADAEAEEEATPPPAKASKKPSHMGKDKAGIESYLKHRLATIKALHKQRVDFAARDVKEWNAYWDKVKEERNLFEVRIARQRLDLFDSLSSLNPKEHSTTISDFERLQTNQIRAFENDQKQKMQDFFASRDKRWREYYSAQEKDRASFAAEVNASWDQLKAALKMKGGSSRRSSSPPPSGSSNPPSSRRF